MFKIDVDAFVRLVLGVSLLVAGAAVIYYALKGAPPISAFFASKYSAEGRDAGSCLLLLLVAAGTAVMGFALLPTDDGGRWSLRDLLWPTAFVGIGLRLIASHDGVIRRWPIAFGEYKVPVGAGLEFVGLMMLFCVRRRDR